jgi:hypothetical protein
MQKGRMPPHPPFSFVVHDGISITKPKAFL